MIKRAWFLVMVPFLLLASALPCFAADSGVISCVHPQIVQVGAAQVGSSGAQLVRGQAPIDLRDDQIYDPSQLLASGLYQVSASAKTMENRDMQLLVAIIDSYDELSGTQWNAKALELSAASKDTYLISLATKTQTYAATASAGSRISSAEVNDLATQISGPLFSAGDYAQGISSFASGLVDRSLLSVDPQSQSLNPQVASTSGLARWVIVVLLLAMVISAVLALFIYRRNVNNLSQAAKGNTEGETYSEPEAVTDVDAGDKADGEPVQGSLQAVQSADHLYPEAVQNDPDLAAALAAKAAQEQRLTQSVSGAENEDHLFSPTAMQQMNVSNMNVRRVRRDVEPEGVPENFELPNSEIAHPGVQEFEKDTTQLPEHSSTQNTTQSIIQKTVPTASQIPENQTMQALSAQEQMEQSQLSQGQSSQIQPVQIQAVQGHSPQVAIPQTVQPTQAGATQAGAGAVQNTAHKQAAPKSVPNAENAGETEKNAAQDPLATPELNQELSSILISTQNSLLSASEDLSVSQDQFGPAATRAFAAALSHAREEHSKLISQLSTGKQIDPAQSTKLSAQAQAIQEQLQRHVDAFTQLRHRPSGVASSLQTTQERGQQAALALGGAQASWQKIRQTYPRARMDYVNANLAYAKRLLEAGRKGLSAAGQKFQEKDAATSIRYLRGAERAFTQVMDTAHLLTIFDEELSKTVIHLRSYPEQIRAHFMAYEQHLPTLAPMRMQLEQVTAQAKAAVAGMEDPITAMNALMSFSDRLTKEIASKLGVPEASRLAADTLPWRFELYSLHLQQILGNTDLRRKHLPIAPRALAARSEELALQAQSRASIDPMVSIDLLAQAQQCAAASTAQIPVNIT